MIRNIVVVEDAQAWRGKAPGLEFVAPEEYLFDPQFQEQRQLRVINLARNYGYLGGGYYISLVAGARGHKVIPSLQTLQALSRKELYRIEAEDLDAQIQKDFARLTDVRFELSVYFGRNLSRKYEKLSRMFFHLFPCPAFRVFFTRERNRWVINSIKPLSPDKIQESHREDFLESLAAYSIERWGARRLPVPARYELAILLDPSERWAPSNPAAIQKFVKAGKAAGIAVEVIGKRDYGLLAQFDGLFIRETTSIENHTYRFAKKAEKEGLVVVDDPKSILACTNKIFMYELFRRGGVGLPDTFVFGEKQLAEVARRFAFPIIVKIPDGSFSRGIEKVADASSLAATCKEFFRHSDYLVAQEFMPTDFDWRIGVFNHKAIFACQYFMSRNHWQIYNHGEAGAVGDHKTFAVEDVDPKVIATALRAARLIGDGLYGVDIKVSGGKPRVVEVNDNPNIDAGVEDQVLGDNLYTLILGEFIARMERMKVRRSPLAAAEPARAAKNGSDA